MNQRWSTKQEKSYAFHHKSSKMQEEASTQRWNKKGNKRMHIEECYEGTECKNKGIAQKSYK